MRSELVIVGDIFLLLAQLRMVWVGLEFTHLTSLCCIVKLFEAIIAIEARALRSQFIVACYPRWSKHITNNALPNFAMPHCSKERVIRSSASVRDTGHPAVKYNTEYTMQNKTLPSL